MRTESFKDIQPGVHLKEFMKEYKLTQSHLAQSINLPPRQISEIIRGKRDITKDTALRLGYYFDNSPQFWINLQTTYDLYQFQKKRARQIKKEVLPLFRAF